MANLSKCTICGSEYSYCPNCADTHAWKFYTDTHEHYQIFMILKQYKAGVFTKAEAKIALERIGINTKSNLDMFKPKIADKIKDILKSSEDKIEKPKRGRSKLFE